jgi:hypothetical protein
MQGKPGAPISAHINAIGTRAWGPYVLSLLMHDCWPYDTADRRPDPSALRALRRTGPNSPTPDFVVCSCAAARCAVCN